MMAKNIFSVGNKLKNDEKPVTVFAFALVTFLKR